MDFQEIKEILNQKLTEIWAYRRYTAETIASTSNKKRQSHA